MRQHNSDTAIQKFHKKKQQKIMSLKTHNNISTVHQFVNYTYFLYYTRTTMRPCNYSHTQIYCCTATQIQKCSKYIKLFSLSELKEVNTPGL